MSWQCTTPRRTSEWYHVTHSENPHRMIIDSHAYCFEPADSPRGYANSQEHLRWVQKAQAGHHQPAFRLRDRVEGPSDVLDPTKGDLDDLPDVDFRIDRAAGRVLWDYRRRDLHQALLPAQPPQSGVHSRQSHRGDGLRGHRHGAAPHERHAGTEQRVPGRVRTAIPRPHPVDGAAR